MTFEPFDDFDDFDDFEGFGDELPELDDQLTDGRACAGGCIWVKPDLCSRCYRALTA